ncbi:MAG: hypothetical protein KDK34_06510, partial [Leptospiraceae bacterium]|nr:hypothetical protein [Leptospiraceae bacterium]
NYGRQKVTGNIIYSSREIPDAGFLPDLQKEIQKRFDGYRADLTLVRVAGDSDLNRLRTPEELSLDTSADTLHDEVRQAHAKDLVRRSLELLVARFPDELGVITEVHINFSMRGMEKVRVFYAGDRFTAETNRMLEAVFRKELRALRGDVHELELIRVGTRSGSVACGPNRNENAYNEAFEALKEILEYSQNNPFLGIQLTTNEEFRRLLESRTTTELQERMDFVLSPDQRCIVRYELSHI